MLSQHTRIKRGQDGINSASVSTGAKLTRTAKLSKLKTGVMGGSQGTLPSRKIVRRT